MPARIVVTRPVHEAGLRMLRAEHEVYVHPDDGRPTPGEDEIIRAARDADALLTLLTDPITPRVLDGCPKLRIVAQYAVGLDNIDLEAARARGILVTHTPDVLTDATADLALALLLSLARHLPEADRYVREGRFRRWETSLLLGGDLRGKTLGIVGFGRIGKAVARRAIGFGMRILYHNRKRSNLTDEYQLGARFVPFETLLEESDFISLHCPLNRESHHLFDADAFRRMKPTAFLINTARGPVVDEAALVEALAEGRLAGAGLDVFEEEPAVHPGLIESDRVLLAPHLGSATEETRAEMSRMCARSILAALAGNEPVPYRAA